MSHDCKREFVFNFIPLYHGNNIIYVNKYDISSVEFYDDEIDVELKVITNNGVKVFDLEVKKDNEEQYTKLMNNFDDLKLHLNL